MEFNNDLDPIQLVEPEPEPRPHALTRVLRIGKEVVKEFAQIVKDANPVEAYRRGAGF